MAMNTATLAASKLRVQEILKETYDNLPDLIPMLFNAVEGNPYRESERTFKGVQNLGFAPQMSDGDSVETDELTNGWFKTLTSRNNMYGTGIDYTYLGKEFDPYKLLVGRAADIAGAMKHTRNQVASNFYENGFTSTASGPTAAAEFLFSATHAGPNGVTYSNLLTSQTLSTAALAGLRANIQDQKTNRGMPIFASGKFTLKVPTALDVQANQLVRSVTVADTADRAQNVIINTEFEVMVDRYATSPQKYYAIQQGHPAKGIIWCQFLEPDLIDIAANTTKNLIASTVMVEAYAAGWNNARGIVGCLGV